jgi:hypothetical protein
VLREAAGSEKAGIVHRAICDIIIYKLSYHHLNIDNSAWAVYSPVPTDRVGSVGRKSASAFRQQPHSAPWARPRRWTPGNTILGTFAQTTAGLRKSAEYAFRSSALRRSYIIYEIRIVNIDNNARTVYSPIRYSRLRVAAWTLGQTSAPSSTIVSSIVPPSGAQGRAMIASAPASRNAIACSVTSSTVPAKVKAST